MMAKSDASFDWLWVQSSVVATFNAPKGQSNLSHSTSRSTIETSDKQSYPDKTYLPTERDRSVSLSIRPDFPDTNGVQRMQTLYDSGTAEVYQIRSGGAAGVDPGDVIFECSMVITQFSKTHNKGELRSIDIMLMPAAAATVDALA
jgi:hypothetical protein